MKSVNGNHIYEGEAIPVNASAFTKNLASTDNTIAKVLSKIDQLTVSSGGTGGASINNYADVYSSTEVKTNKYWTDGRPIYRKVVSCGNMPNVSSVSIPHGITGIAAFTSCAVYFGTNTIAPIPYAGVSSASVTAQVYVDFTNIILSDTYNWSSNTAFAVLEYTKTADATGTVPTNGPSGTYGTSSIDTFTGDGTKTVFTLSKYVQDNINILVDIAGTIQEPVSQYTVSGNQLTFVSAPGSGQKISVRHMGATVATSMDIYTLKKSFIL